MDEQLKQITKERVGIAVALLEQMLSGKVDPGVALQQWPGVTSMMTRFWSRRGTISRILQRTTTFGARIAPTPNTKLSFYPGAANRFDRSFGLALPTAEERMPKRRAVGKR